MGDSVAGPVDGVPVDQAAGSARSGHLGVQTASGIGELSDRLDGCLIALDFDGTLAPLVADPEQSRPVAGVVATLGRLADLGARIALVTGRDAETVLRRSGMAGIRGLSVSGVHGAQLWSDGALRSADEAPGMAELRSSLPPVLTAVDPAVWLEDKGLSLVVHTRRAADPTAALAALEPELTRLATAAGLQVHPGHLVHEIRAPGSSKGDAVAELLRLDTTAALYGGDDLGDLPAVQAVHRWRADTARPAITIAVGPSEPLAAVTDLHLQSPADLASLLAQLVPH